MKILSNLQTAKQVASEMGNASDSIQGALSKSITKADKTTVMVSGKAIEANEEAIKLVQIFNQCFLETIDNIRSVAEEFERTDQELNETINQMLPMQEMLQDMKTYNKAKNG